VSQNFLLVRIERGNLNFTSGNGELCIGHIWVDFAQAIPIIRDVLFY
jgi:hypothetical protein